MFYLQVWVYNYHDHASNKSIIAKNNKDNTTSTVNIAAGCCEMTKPFMELFAPDPLETNDTRILKGWVDAVYYSTAHYSMYFIKGEHVWKSVKTDTGNTLRYEGVWWNIWYDICDP